MFMKIFVKTKILLVGLKSKMYSLINVDDEEVTKAKGVNKKTKHREFVGVLFNKKVIRHNMERIQSKFQKLKLITFVRFPCLVLMIKDYII